MSLEHSERVELFISSLTDISKFTEDSFFYRLAQTQKDLIQSSTIALLLETFPDFGTNLFPKIRLELSNYTVNFDSTNGDLIIQYSNNRYILLFHSVKNKPLNVHLEGCYLRNRAIYGNKITHLFYLSPLNPMLNLNNNSMEIAGELWEYISYDRLLYAINGLEPKFKTILNDVEEFNLYKYLHFKEFNKYCEYCKKSVELLQSNLNEYFFLPILENPKFTMLLKYWHYAIFYNKIQSVEAFLKIEKNRHWHQAEKKRYWKNLF